jgi:hypothetical protein
MPSDVLSSIQAVERLRRAAKDAGASPEILTRFDDSLRWLRSLDGTAEDDPLFQVVLRRAWSSFHT